MTEQHAGNEVAHHTGDPEWDRLLAEMDDARHILEHLTVDLFCEATENASHYVNEAAKGMAHAAYLVAYAAEVVGWVGSALHWLGRIVPGLSWVGDVVEHFGTVTEEKALKASFEALGLAALGVEIASLGWDARSTGHIAADAYRRIRQLAVEVEQTARGVFAILTS